MRSTTVRLSILFVSLACVTAIALAQQGNSSDEDAIRILMEEKFSSAFNAGSVDKGLEILRGVLSDKGYVSVSPQSEKPSEAFVGDKKWYCEQLAKWLANGPIKMVHKVKQITIIGPIAYEIGESKYVGPDGKARTEVWLNVLARQDGGWRLVFATPADSTPKALQQMDTCKKSATEPGK